MADTVKQDYGMLDVIWSALKEHQKQHYMAKPRRFELHPALKPGLITEVQRKEQSLSWSLMHDLLPRDRLQTPRLFGVPLLWTCQAKVPRLLNCKDEYEPL